MLQHPKNVVGKLYFIQLLLLLIACSVAMKAHEIVQLRTILHNELSILAVDILQQEPAVLGHLLTNPNLVDIRLENANNQLIKHWPTTQPASFIGTSQLRFAFTDNKHELYQLKLHYNQPIKPLDFLSLLLFSLACYLWFRLGPITKPDLHLVTEGSPEVKPLVVSRDAQLQLSIADQPKFDGSDLLKSIQNQLSDAVMLFDRSGQVIECNAASQRLFGQALDSKVKIEAFFPEQYVRVQLSYFAQSVYSKFENPAPLELQNVQFIGTDQKIITLNIRVTVIAGPFEPYICLILSRHAEISQIAARLTQLDAIKDALLQSNLSAIVVINEHDQVIEFNPSAERLFGFERTEALGQLMAELIIPVPFRARHYAGVAAFVRTQKSNIMRRRIEISALNKQGHEFPIEMEVSPVKVEKGWMFLAVIIDISERKQSQEKIQSALKEAEQANLAKSKFLASMSHEIRTPLHAILGLIECLQNTALNDQQFKYIYAAQSAGDNLLEMVNDILDLAKIEAGKLQPHLTMLKPLLLVEEYIEIFKHQIWEKDLAVYVIAAPDIPRVIRSDLTLLRQILSNLLSNASKYTLAGAITVRLYCTPGEGQLTTPHLCIEIKDTGPGLSSDQMKILFDEFTRFHENENSATGTGLGLVICQQLTKLLGGKLEVCSSLGKGASFTLKLPIENMTPVRTYRQFAALHVYVVSNNVHSVDCLTQQLTALGVTVSVVANFKALLQSTPEPSDVVIFEKELALDPQSILMEFVRLHPQVAMICAAREHHNPSINYPQVFATLLQPYRKQDLIRALRGAARRVYVDLSKHLKEQHRSQVLLMKPQSEQVFQVLVVDDSEVNRLTIRTFLGFEGMMITEAVNGLDAIEKVKSASFHLILMDMRMPKMGGLEATRFIREQHLADNTPIIALTAHALAEEKQACFAVGMQDFLTKPIGKAMLLKRVMDWLTSGTNHHIDYAAPAPSQTAEEEYPLLDVDALTQFKSQLTDETYLRLQKLFLDETGRRIKEIMQFLAEQNFERVEISVHALKSSAQTFGAMRLGHVAKMAEQACNDQQHQQAQFYCEQLSEIFQLTLTEYASGSHE